MFETTARRIFILLFLAMLVIPLVTTNLEEEKISVTENRKLAPMAHLRREDGSLNTHFLRDFDTWINDNIGQRSLFVVSNARLRYDVFGLLPDNSDMYLGPHGELNYATRNMLKDYQHANLHTLEHLQEFAESMQYLKDYVEAGGARFYYYQCWDKHSIYPEYFPETVFQTGTRSKTDGIVQALLEGTDVTVLSPKQALLDAKSQYAVYSVWGDPTHWSQRGAYLGYRMLMDAINADAAEKGGTGPYRVLQESDYEITTPDAGKTFIGGIHETDYIEDFAIRDPRAQLTNEKLTAYADDERHRYFTNPDADNRTRLLVIGDSYFNSFIMDDLAESFYETIIIWGDHLGDVQTILDTYDADIVVVEAAERVDRTGAIIKGVKEMRE